MNSEQSSRSLTVVQLVPALEGGGVEGCVLETAAALVRRGHRSVVVSAGGRLVDELTAAGSTHSELDLGKKSPLTLLKVPRLSRLLRELRADLVHARSRMPAWVALLARKLIAQKHRPRFLTTVHGLNSVNRYSKVMTYGDRVVAVSQCCRDYVLANYPDTPPEKIVVIPHGIDRSVYSYGFQPSQEWRTQWLAEYPRLEGRFTVLLPGRLTRLKGHLDFLSALQILRSQEIPVHGLIVGGEDPRRREYADEVRRRIAELDLKDRVTLTGHRSDLREIMSIASVVVSTSTKPESFGRTVLESLSLGRPTFGYDHGGVGEILAKLYSKGRVPACNPAALAESLAKVSANEFPLPQPSNAFELADVMEREMQLYEELVAAGSSR